MDDFGEVTLLADQVVNGLVEGYRKPGNRAAGHLTGDLNRMLEFKQRKSQFDGLGFGDGARGVDKHAVGTDILYNIPEGALSDRVLDNDERGSARMVALVGVAAAFAVHFAL